MTSLSSTGTEKVKRKPRKQTAENDPVMALYRAVAAYVESRGGAVIIAEGIQLQEWSADKNRFTVGIKCFGRKPTFAAPPAPKGDSRNE